MRASDLMTRDPVTVRPQTKLGEAARLLRTLDVRHLPVVDSEGTLVGMLSDRDLRALEVPYVLDSEIAGTIREALNAPIAEVMSSDVIYVDSEADAAEIIDVMLEYKVGAVPVVDADGSLTGIVSYVDVLREVHTDGAQLAMP